MSVQSARVIAVVVASLAAACAVRPEGPSSDQGQAVASASLPIFESVLTYAGYDSTTGQCTKTQHMLVFRPVAPGRYPVMTYTVGTGGIYDAPEGRTVASEMAKRGFVAASIEYDSLDPAVLLSYAPIYGAASCAYAKTESTSAIGTLCSLSDADCSRGVVTGGMSQGADLAILAQSYDSDVRAAWVMGFGKISIWGETLSWVLPQDRLRIVDGTEQDPADLEAITGCTSTTQSCFQSNGSGWYIVQDSELESGQSGHCYYIAPRTDGTPVGCTNYPPNGFDPGWAPPSTLPWSLDTNLAWLASFTN